MGVNAGDYFNKHATEAGELKRTPLVKAYQVKAGKSVETNAFGLPMVVKTAEDGWQVYFQNQASFIAPDDFANTFKAIDPATLNIKKKDIPAGAKPKAVSKGQTIVVQPWSDIDVGVQTKAKQAGWLVSIDGKQRYFSDIEFRTEFNTMAAPLDPAQAFYRFKADQPSHSYIILQEDVTFDFAAGAYTAVAGSILYPNAEDEDGYTVDTPNSFARNYTVSKPAVTP